MENSEQLNSTITDALDKLGELDPTSEDYQNVVKSVNTLYQLQQEDYDLNVKGYQLEENDKKLELEQEKFALEKEKVKLEKERNDLERDKFKDSKKWYNKIPWETIIKCGVCLTAIGVTKYFEEQGMRIDVGVAGRNTFPKL